MLHVKKLQLITLEISIFSCQLEKSACNDIFKNSEKIFLWSKFVKNSYLCGLKSRNCNVYFFKSSDFLKMSLQAVLSQLTAKMQSPSWKVKLKCLVAFLCQHQIKNREHGNAWYFAIKPLTNQMKKVCGPLKDIYEALSTGRSEEFRHKGADHRNT